MIEDLTLRAEARGMNPVEFLRWRNTLRQDYQQAFDPPDYKPATSLGFGWPQGVARGDRVNIETGPREFYETKHGMTLGDWCRAKLTEPVKP